MPPTDFGSRLRELVRRFDGPIHAALYGSLALYAYWKHPTLAIWAYIGLGTVAAIELLIRSGRTWIARVEHLLHAVAYSLLGAYTALFTPDALVFGVSYALLCLTAFAHFLMHDPEE